MATHRSKLLITLRRRPEVASYSAPGLPPATHLSIVRRNKNERKVMQNKFDELTKAMAQSVTRRGALKKFGVGLAGLVLASLGLAHGASGRDHEPIKGCDHC